MGLNLLKTKVASPPVSPIGVAQFAQRLAQILQTSRVSKAFDNVVKPRKIGLAISGGVDSMALALLCSRVKELTKSKPINEVQDFWKRLSTYQFQAFIVDHAVREGSNEEAHSVAKVLQDRGIPAEVLKISWNDGANLKVPNFESLARRFRFQILGKACRSHGIDSLFLAHHQNDQAETVFMRMAAGHKMQGLTGMKVESEIPECYGLHGVHESGSHNAIHNRFPHDSLQRSVSSTDSELKMREQLLIESGGVKIYRPLLAFGKDQLRKTCEEAKIEWFEDHTNKDPTLTMRNAVRSIFNSKLLPRALSMPSIIALCERAKETSASNLKVMNEWLKQCSICRFETRSGILLMRFIDMRSLALGHMSESQVRLIASMLIRRIIMLVTPNEHVELSTLTNILSSIFPEYFDPNGSEKPRRQTVAGVQFDPCSEYSPNNKTAWFISRQLPTQSSRKIPFLEILAQGDEGNQWSPWHLIDGRYWFRAKHHYDVPIRLEAFRKEHMAHFITRLNPHERERLQADLRMLAPRDVRWTLPAIVQGGRVVALPTLDCVLPEEKGKVEWQVRYKKVDLEGLPFVGSSSSG